MSRFSGRCAVVTGASRGIGAALAERLAADGADVVLVARTLDTRPAGAGSLTEVANRLHHYGGIVGIVVADLADADDRARVVPEAQETLGGPVDILVNAAAAHTTDPVDRIPLGLRRRIFEIGVHAPVDLALAALPGMRTSGQGWIVGLSGVGPSTSPVSVAAATARDLLMTALATDVRIDGVRVNAIIATPADLAAPHTVVEAAAALCCCGPDVTGGTWSPDDVLDGLRLE